MEYDAGHWIRALGLTAHPEGGYFRETYRSEEQFAAGALPARFSGPRPFLTSIYYLLRSGERSLFHRIQSDEVWCFHCGCALRLVSISPDGALEEALLGGEPGGTFQSVVRAGCWFGAYPARADSYSLVSCIVAPGFDFADFELASRAQMLRSFPELSGVIRLLTNP